MPNWCENSLYIRGPHEDLKRFVEFARSPEGVFDFNRFIPYPERFERLDRLAELWEAWKAGRVKLDELSEEEIAFLVKCRERPLDGYNQGGYDWCVENWGTKWNACEAYLYFHGENEVVYNFDTAWSPPLPVIRKASELFPSLEFRLEFFEAGMGFCGKYVCKGGKVLEEEWSEYHGDRGG